MLTTHEWEIERQRAWTACFAASLSFGRDASMASMAANVDMIEWESKFPKPKPKAECYCGDEVPPDNVVGATKAPCSLHDK